MDHSNFIVAIQVRNRSTRLPGKMLRPFFRGMAIPELIVKELLNYFPAHRIVMATSTHLDDAAIAELAEQLHIRASRGSEEDVLLRVLEAVRTDPAEYVVRVCGDNPFLRGSYILELVQLVSHRPCDYASFSLPDGTPTILSHLGLFAEIVRKTALEQIEENASSPRHREHMTSHILDYPRLYDCRFLDVPALLQDVTDLRLTVDTEADFEACQLLYDAVVERYGPGFSAAELLGEVRSRPTLQATMAGEIAANQKR